MFGAFDGGYLHMSSLVIFISSPPPKLVHQHLNTSSPPPNQKRLKPDTLQRERAKLFIHLLN